LHNSNEARIVSSPRQASQEEFLVAVNLSNRPFIGVVEVANAVSFHEVTPEAGVPSADRGSAAGPKGGVFASFSVKPDSWYRASSCQKWLVAPWGGRSKA
jgi:hypothetical protein